MQGRSVEMSVYQRAYECDGLDSLTTPQDGYGYDKDGWGSHGYIYGVSNYKKYSKNKINHQFPIKINKSNSQQKEQADVRSLPDEPPVVSVLSDTESMREFLNDPLKEFSLPILGAPGGKHKLAVSFIDFKPEEVMQQFSDIIGSENILPLDLFQEIEELISMQIRSDNSLLDTTHKPLRGLKRKIQLVFSKSEPKVAHFFLRSLFPHFAIRKELEWWTNKSTEQQPTVSTDGDVEVPRCFCLFAFGGLVPSKKVLKEGVQDAIIVTHLYGLFSSYKSEIPILTCHYLIKKHIESSQLSDERRLNELCDLEVLTPGGDMSKKTKFIYASVGDAFREQVNFGLIVEDQQSDWWTY